MSNLTNLSIYNPQSLNDADFKRSFVARHSFFQKLFARLAQNPPKGQAQHFLIIGQRGMGKSSMLRRLSIEFETTEDICEKFAPLVFREEQYNVHSIEIFWENCLDSLSDWLEKQGEHEISRDIDSFNFLGSDTISTEEFFFSICAKIGRRPILFIDNIDIVLDGLGNDQWSFRRTLQGNNGPIIVGASTAYLEASSKPNDAFYDFFQVLVLEKLTLADVVKCLKSISDVRPSGERVRELIEQEPDRIRVLHSLTGGNPRTLTLLYMVLEFDPDVDVFADLESLLDQVTVLYKARVEDLPPQSRVVLDAVALNWNPSTAADIAKVTKLKTTTVSTQLDRLKNEGLIEKVRLPDTKRSAFQLAERFFNIWYLMRHSSRRQRVKLKWLINFLKSFYTQQQLALRAKEILERPRNTFGNNKDFFIALGDAVEDQDWGRLLKFEAANLHQDHSGEPSATPVSTTGSSSEIEVSPARPETEKDWEQLVILQYVKNVNLETAKATLDEALAKFEKSEAILFLAGALYHDKIGDLECALEFFQKASASDPESYRSKRALAIVSNGIGDLDAAKKFYHEAACIRSEEHAAWFEFAEFLQNSGSDPRLAEECYTKALEISPEASRCRSRRGNLRRYYLNDFTGAHDDLMRAISDDPEDEYPWYILAWLLKEHGGKVGRASHSVEQCFQEAIALSKQPGYLYRDLARHLRLQADYLNAEEAYNCWLERHPGIEAYTEFADFVLEARSDSSAARSLYEKAIAIEPTSASDLGRLGYLHAYYFDDLRRSSELYRQAIERIDNHRDEDKGNRSICQANLLAVGYAVGESQVVEPFDEKTELAHHPFGGDKLIESIRLINSGDISGAVGSLAEVLRANDHQIYEYYRGFLILFIRSALRRGHGFAVMKEFRKGNLDNQFWPIFVALQAAVEGRSKLDAANPEVRPVASHIFNWIQGGKIVDGFVE